MYPGSKENMAKIKREQGNIGKQGSGSGKQGLGSGKILPINPQDYQSENYANKTPGNKGFYQGHPGICNPFKRYSHVYYSKPKIISREQPK